MAAKSESEDPELDALLDSALKDFGDATSIPKAGTVAGAAAELPAAPDSRPRVSVSGATKSGATSSPSVVSGPPGHPDTSVDSVSDRELDEALDMLMADDPYMKEQFGKFVETAARTGGDDPASRHELAAALAETLGSLARDAESLKSDVGDDADEEDLMKALAESLKLEGSDGVPAGVMPMMQNMMKSILSKDVLYPSLKDLADKFPHWLAKNKDTLSKKSYDCHARQFDIVMKILELFEAERSGDSETAKSRRFEEVLALMTQLQDCGALPKEIVGEMAPGLEFDEEGVPKLPGMNQCPIM